MIQFLLTLILLGSARGTESELKSFKLPPEQGSKNVFDQAPPRDWAIGYQPVTLAWSSDDPRPEGDFIRAYLDHLGSAAMNQVFSDPNTNGPLLGKQLIVELARMAGMPEGSAATIYPSPSAGEFGVMLGTLSVPFRKTTTDPDTLAMTKTFTVTADQGAVLRHIAETLERYEQARHDSSRLQTATRMSEINEAWKNYLQNGYSQYPWELLINSSSTADPGTSRRTTSSWSSIRRSDSPLTSSTAPPRPTSRLRS
jgi:hypothetical protein